MLLNIFIISGGGAGDVSNIPRFGSCHYYNFIQIEVGKNVSFILIKMVLVHCFFALYCEILASNHYSFVYELKVVALFIHFALYT